MEKKPSKNIDDFKVANPIRLTKRGDRKNSDLVAAMYAMYCMGPDGKPCTLKEVGAVYHRSKQAIYDMFKSRGYELRSRPIRPHVIIDGRKFNCSYDGYWRASAGDRMFLHTYIWEKHNGKLPQGHGISHIDKDLNNNNIENLIARPMNEVLRKSNQPIKKREIH